MKPYMVTYLDPHHGWIVKHAISNKLASQSFSLQFVILTLHVAWKLHSCNDSQLLHIPSKLDRSFLPPAIYSLFLVWIMRWDISPIKIDQDAFGILVWWLGLNIYRALFSWPTGWISVCHVFPIGFATMKFSEYIFWAQRLHSNKAII